MDRSSASSSKVPALRVVRARIEKRKEEEEAIARSYGRSSASISRGPPPRVVRAVDEHFALVDGEMGINAIQVTKVLFGALEEKVRREEDPQYAIEKKKEEKAQEKEAREKERNRKKYAFNKEVAAEYNKRYSNRQTYPKAEPDEDYQKPTDHSHGWYKTEPGIEFGVSHGRGGTRAVDWKLHYSIGNDKKPTIKFPFRHHQGNTNMSQVRLSYEAAQKEKKKLLMENDNIVFPDAIYGKAEPDGDYQKPSFEIATGVNWIQQKQYWAVKLAKKLTYFHP